MDTSLSTGERVLRAASVGAAVGLIYLALSLFQWVSRGHAMSDLPPDVWPRLAWMYLLGGLSTGAIVGLVQPSMTTLGRTLAFFVFACLPLAVAFNHIYYPTAQMQYKDPTPRIIGLALFFGFIGGMTYWRKHGDQQ